jgi:hypothetical protein
MIRSGGRSVTTRSAGLAGADDVGFGVAVALEGVLDQAGNVLLVFDDEYAGARHDDRA